MGNHTICSLNHDYKLQKKFNPKFFKIIKYQASLELQFFLDKCIILLFLIFDLNQSSYPTSTIYKSVGRNIFSSPGQYFRYVRVRD